MLVRRQNVCIELNMCLVDSDSIFSYKKSSRLYGSESKSRRCKL